MAKDYTKYKISGMDKTFNKSRLVQAIVKDYIAKNTPNWETLQTAFPNSLQGSKDVVAKKDAGVKERDFYMDSPFSLSDDTEIVTCRQWGKDNFPNFLTCRNFRVFHYFPNKYDSGKSEGITSSRTSNLEKSKHQH